MNAEQKTTSEVSRINSKGRAMQRRGALTWVIRSGHHCFCKVIELVLHVYCISNSPDRARQAHLHHCRKSSHWLRYFFPPGNMQCGLQFMFAMPHSLLYLCNIAGRAVTGCIDFFVWQHTNCNMASSLCSQDLRSTVSRAMLQEEYSLAASLSWSGNMRRGLQPLFTKPATSLLVVQCCRKISHWLCYLSPLALHNVAYGSC